MSAVLALIEAQWRVTVSYRLQTLLSFGGLAVTVVPLFFIAQAVQPVMAPAIQSEGASAFGFLLVGSAAMMVVAVALSAIPGALSAGIGNGTLEALLSTPVRAPALLAGMSTFALGMALVRAAVLIAGGWLLGEQVTATGIPLAAAILLVIVIAHLAIGMISGAMVLAFRTAGPFSRLALLASSLLGGVYYPTHVIPSWLRSVSDVLPLSYGLRALRPVLLQGASLPAVRTDLLILVVETIGLAVAGCGALWFAFRYARRQGTLSQY